MREIKFRAWDKNDEQMVKVLGIDYQHRDIRYEGEKGWNLMWGKNAASLDDFEVMQYTGLKDKNSKEIYEGDILRNVDPIEYGNKVEAGDLWYIEFAITAGCAGLWLYNECLDTVPFDKTEIGRLVFNDDEGSEWFEVVGNIYENPELLAPTKETEA